VTALQKHEITKMMKGRRRISREERIKGDLNTHAKVSVVCKWALLER
jgi:hypothetical protein